MTSREKKCRVPTNLQTLSSPSNRIMRASRSGASSIPGSSTRVWRQHGTPTLEDGNADEEAEELIPGPNFYLQQITRSGSSDRVALGKNSRLDPWAASTYDASDRISQLQCAINTIPRPYLSRVFWGTPIPSDTTRYQFCILGFLSVPSHWTCLRCPYQKTASLPSRSSDLNTPSSYAILTQRQHDPRKSIMRPKRPGPSCVTGLSKLPPTITCEQFPDKANLGDFAYTVFIKPKDRGHIAFSTQPNSVFGVSCIRMDRLASATLLEIIVPAYSKLLGCCTDFPRDTVFTI
ncbi:hypothetical protein B0H14DRAFT_3144830 [Mycena olivaceomarginata]|nr:hypothetical protein B0H14DRAFT_3144830 [Mycena olivaceomarginata]